MHGGVKMTRLNNILSTSEIYAHIFSNPGLCYNLYCMQHIMELRNSTSNPLLCMKSQNYSIIGETDDALSELSSLRVFQVDKRTPTLDLVDVFDLSGQPRKSGELSFHDNEDLDKYLATNQMIGGIRFM